MGLRKRTAGAAKKTAKEDESKAKQEKSAVTKDDETKKEEEEQSSGVFVQFLVDFPLISAALTTGILIGLYKLSIIVVLQYPQYLGLRPAVGVTDERQLLIVATQGSGSTQVADTLSSTLGIEIGHETTDASLNFVRDGTASWFHGIRFFEDEHPLNIDLLCSNFKTYMGFHPSMYGPSNCTKGSEDRAACFKQECLDLLEAEKGCGLRGDCITPFRKTLHLARHPLRTIESLVVKFCKGSDLNNVTAAPEFMYYMLAMYPQIKWLEQSCVEAVALYVIEFSYSILDKTDGIFRIEETTPCQVAELAGFTSDPVHGPSIDKVKKRCDRLDSKANEKFPKGKNQRNKDVINFEWKDLRGGMYRSKRPEGDYEIEERVKDLTHKLGYDTIDE